MCGPHDYQRFSLVAHSYKTCEQGYAHETDCLVDSYCGPHALYRAVHDFYKKHENEKLDVHITAPECK